MVSTIDHIAYSFMEWCSDFSHTYEKKGQDIPLLQPEIFDELLQLLQDQNNKVEIWKDQNKLKAFDNCKPVFSISNHEKKTITKLVIESDSNSANYLNEIDNAYNELKEIALIAGDNQKVDSLIIGLYFDISKRGILHEYEFFEIFNNLKVGCAIKRVK